MRKLLIAFMMLLLVSCDYECGSIDLPYQKALRNSELSSFVFDTFYSFTVVNFGKDVRDKVAEKINTWDSFKKMRRDLDYACEPDLQTAFFKNMLFKHISWFKKYKKEYESSFENIPKDVYSAKYLDGLVVMIAHGSAALIKSR
jgi:hypothetical protein